MLFKSKYNLESSAISFLRDNEEVTLFSAYIRTEQLRKINETKNIKQIVVRWEVGDICFGASDLELYDYCRDNNITELLLPETVKDVYCYNNQITELNIPNTVKKVCCDREVKGLDNLIGNTNIQLF